MTPIRVLVDDPFSPPRQGVGSYEVDVNAVTDMLCCFALAMANYDKFTDVDFDDTRVQHREEVLDHLRSRPKISHDATTEKWFNKIDYTFLLIP